MVLAQVSGLAGNNASAASFDVTGTLVAFDNSSSLLANPQVDQSHLYEGVISGVNARLTVLARTAVWKTNPVVDQSIPYGPFVDNKHLNVALGTQLDQPPTYQSRSLTFRIDFLDATTGAPVTLNNALISAKDVDGETSGTRGTGGEFLEVAGIDGYTLSSDTTVNVSTTSSGAYRFEGRANRANATEVQGWVEVRYDAISSVTLTVGESLGWTANIPVVFGQASASSWGTDTAVSRPSYTVTYDANEANSGTVPSSTTTDGVVTVAGNTGSLARDSYTFDGWNSRADGLGTAYPVGSEFTPSADMTLYAKWTASASTTTTSSSTTTTSTSTTTTSTTTTSTTVASTSTTTSTTSTTDPSGSSTSTTSPAGGATSTTEVPSTTSTIAATTTSAPNQDSTSTTSPDSSGPRPIPGPSGGLPRQQPGSGLATTDGVDTPVELLLKGGNALVMSGDGFRVRVSRKCTTDCTATNPETEAETVSLVRGEHFRLSGRGYEPGSTVHAWVFSKPVYLGEISVGANGTFSRTFSSITVKTGSHTIQVNGRSTSGKLRSANLGIVVSEGSGVGDKPMPGAGAESDGSILFASLLMLLGFSMIDAARRRI